MLYKDQFNADLKNWVLEYDASPASSIAVKDEQLVIDLNGGATVWLNKVLKGNIMITYKRKVIMDSGRNDRLSDLNQFWMAQDPKRKNGFTRSGEFSQCTRCRCITPGLEAIRIRLPDLENIPGTGKESCCLTWKIKSICW